MPKFDVMYAHEKISEKNNPIKVIIMTGLLNKAKKLTLNKFKIDEIFVNPTNPKKIVEFIKNN